MHPYKMFRSRLISLQTTQGMHGEHWTKNVLRQFGADIYLAPTLNPL